VNLGEASIVVRRRGLLEVVDLAFRFVAGVAPVLFARLAAVTLLPCWLVCAVARWAFGWSWLAVWFLALTLATLVQGVFTIAVGRLMFSEAIGARAVLGQFVRRLPTYFGALLATRALIVLGSLLLLLAPLAWVSAAFVHEAVLLEGASSWIEAVRRSTSFSRHHGRSTFELLLVLSAIMIAAVVVGEALGHGIVEFVLQLGQPFGALRAEGGSLYAIAGLLASVPLCATTRFLAYIDARTRRDGWDIQVRFMAIQAEAEQSVR
jgi:hypothetical protein